MLSYKPQDFKQMMHLKAEITKALLPYRQNTEAGLAVLALLMCAKILINLYPPQTRAELLEVAVAFLAGSGVDRRLDVTPGELAQFKVN